MGAGIGGSGGESNSGFGQSSVPGFAKGYYQSFAPVGQQLLQQYQGQNNPATVAGNNLVNQELSGYYLNPYNNPTFQPTVNAITGTASDYLQQNLADQDRTANAGGMLLSTKNQQQKAQTSRLSAQDVANQIAQLAGNQYSQERGIQQGAVGQGQQLANAPLNNAEQIIQLLLSGQKGGQSNSTNWSAEGSASYGAPQGTN
jgi:hypothetical protein